MDTTRLRAAMRRCNITNKRLAESVGINESTFYRKLALGGRGFSVEQAEQIAVLLKMTPSEASNIFFDTNSQKRE